MTINIALAKEQEQRWQNDLAAVEAQIDLDTDLYSVGYWDGLIDAKPTRLEKQSYWDGYQIGQREYWAQKLKVEIPTQF